MLFVERVIIPAMRGKGKMSCGQIYEAVRHHARHDKMKLSANWRSTIRNTLQRHCYGNPKYNGTNLFIHHDWGIWEHRQ